MSILDANGAIACAECGRQAQAVRDRLKDENDKLRKLVCELYEDQCCDGDRWKYRGRMQEIGIEVEDA